MRWEIGSIRAPISMFVSAWCKRSTFISTVAPSESIQLRNVLIIHKISSYFRLDLNIKRIQISAPPSPTMFRLWEFVMSSRTCRRSITWWVGLSFIVSFILQLEKKQFWGIFQTHHNNFKFTILGSRSNARGKECIKTRSNQLGIGTGDTTNIICVSPSDTFVISSF